MDKEEFDHYWMNGVCSRFVKRSEQLVVYASQILSHITGEPETINLGELK